MNVRETPSTTTWITAIPPQSCDVRRTPVSPVPATASNTLPIVKSAARSVGDPKFVHLPGYADVVSVVAFRNGFVRPLNTMLAGAGGATSVTDWSTAGTGLLTTTNTWTPSVVGFQVGSQLSVMSTPSVEKIETVTGDATRGSFVAGSIGRMTPACATPRPSVIHTANPHAARTIERRIVIGGSSRLSHPPRRCRARRPGR